MAFFGLFRSSAEPASAPATAPPPTPPSLISSPSPDSIAATDLPTRHDGDKNGYRTGQKRRITPPPSDRSASVVAYRWRARGENTAHEETQDVKVAVRHHEKETAAPAEAVSTSWMDRFHLLRLASRSTPALPDSAEAENGSDSAAAAEESNSGASSLADEVDMVGDHVYTDDGRDDDNDGGASFDLPNGKAYLLPRPRPLRVSHIRPAAATFAGDGKGGMDVDGGYANGSDYDDDQLAFPDDEYEGGLIADVEEEDDEDAMATDDSGGEDDDDEGAWLNVFEDEMKGGDDDDDNGDDDNGDNDHDASSTWDVDEDELAAYAEGVTAIHGYVSWTRDEKRLHRLLSLRGFHPLMPAAWNRDFLGVPMYPSLFAPHDSDKPVVISNQGGQFRATKALRSLFDLQARVTSLRQAGNTQRISAIIETELRRYIAWAAADAGLDRCAPLAAMPNIAAKRFSRRLTSSNNRRCTRTLARRIQDYFRSWAARYRAYYANLPDFEDAALAVTAAAASAAESTTRPTRRRLRPPRILYGFVVVQHIVMLLAIDAARPHARPRCFADFNMSLGDRWLDASLSVAIPVHVARAAQMRCIQGLVLPARDESESDDDR